MPRIRLGRVFERSNSSSVVPLTRRVGGNVLPHSFHGGRTSHSFLPYRARRVRPIVQRIIRGTGSGKFATGSVRVLTPVCGKTTNVSTVGAVVRRVFGPGKGGGEQRITFFSIICQMNSGILRLIGRPRGGIFGKSVNRVATVRFTGRARRGISRVAVLFSAIRIACGQGG